MGRRRFDHLFVELSVAVGRRLSRYRLWLAFHELGCDPEDAGRNELLAFCDGPLSAFLRSEGVALSPRRQRSLRRRVARFDPSFPTPEEHFAALTP